MELPAGEHTIEFRFEPAAYYLGNKVSLVSNLFIFGLLIFALIRKGKKESVE
jgi:uncharacterized membrane protein YfhO